MKVHRSYDGLDDRARGAVVAIGNFDGVHRGHKALLEAAAAKAAELGTKAGAITFEPHPLQLLRPEIAPTRLTPLRAKAESLGLSGIEHVYALKFDRSLREKSPEAFVRDVLVQGLGVRHVVVGYDFRFGHKASGDVEGLRALGDHFGFGVTVIQPVSEDGDVCSSSRIRDLVAAGEVERASAMLGHPFFLMGRVVPGDRRGRELGYPTANIRPPHGKALWPRAGIYAVRAAWEEDGKRVVADGAASLGLRPTFDDRQGRLLEIHLLDRGADLYGKRLCCQFIARLRDELAFDDVEALRDQMAKDCEDARTALGNVPLHAYLKD
ncbi:MAG: bifunctional riboflavin kinase/FAD synthetase [Geminicoccaceae bacterium]